MTEIRIIVPFDPATLSPNVRMHHMKRARLTAAARQIAFLGWHAAGRPRLIPPVDVKVLVYRKRAMDSDNLVAGMKACRDGLFNGAITASDDEHHFRSYIVQQITRCPAHVAGHCTFIVRGRKARGIKANGNDSA